MRRRPVLRDSILPLTLLFALALAMVVAGAVLAQDDDFTSTFDRDRCTFTTVGSNPYFPLWPGYVLVFEGLEEDDESQLVEISLRISVLGDTEMVDGVRTRVVEEYEEEDGELIEISRNFFVMCRETGDVWYFGEDVDIYEEGEVVSHEGAWRAGAAGAEPGIFMPGTPLLGARHFQEMAPGVAEDQAEIASLDESLEVPYGSFDDLLLVEESSAIDPDAESEKWYSAGLGLVRDDAAELVDVTPPPCIPDETTLCLNDGRFRVEAEWTDATNASGAGMTVLPSDDTGEFWFFSPNNTELLVKVLDACDLPGFNTFWVFAGGLTDAAVELTVTDTATSETRTYTNDLGTPFEPVVDTAAFATCP